MKKTTTLLLIFIGYFAMAQCPSINSSSTTSVEFAVANGECNSYPSTVEVTNNDTGMVYIMTISCQGNSPKLTYENGNANIGNNFSVSLDGGITTCTYINGVLPVEENELEIEKLVLYPNPIQKNRMLTIINSTKNDISVFIYDITGKTVVNVKNNLSNLDVSNLKSGIYLVKILTDKKSITKKLVII